MKTLEEKKLLVKMARAFGQPVDQASVGASLQWREIY